jgi:hypothetical protein
MLQYAAFVGEWEEYYRAYKYQRLPSAGHSAVEDCLATLDVIRTMAGARKLKRWYEFWVAG